MPFAFVGFAALGCGSTALLAVMSGLCRATGAQSLVNDCGNSWVGLLYLGHTPLFHIVE